MTSKLWTNEQFNCPVCLDLPNDPVTIPCGHSYCMACIKDFWSNDEPKGIYSCPQCRQVFCPMPPLSKNTMLADAVECCLPAFVCDWDSSIPNCILFHLRRQSNFSSSVLRHMCGCFSCACI
uniref:RING-type domain-containing protein n=1 Tax=Takifugu rubripes TaxID=31033 RepID=H2TPA6_TAKRU